MDDLLNIIDNTKKKYDGLLFALSNDKLLVKDNNSFVERIRCEAKIEVLQELKNSIKANQVV